MSFLVLQEAGCFASTVKTVPRQYFFSGLFVFLRLVYLMLSGPCIHRIEPNHRI